MTDIVPLPLRFRAKNICMPKRKADSRRNYAEAELIKFL
jgi:hypothetical protein